MHLVSFCSDSCKILQYEKKFQKNSIMADFGSKNCNFRTNFIVITLFLRYRCYKSPGFAFISFVHLISNKRKIQVSIMSGYLMGTQGSYARSNTDVHVTLLASRVAFMTCRFLFFFLHDLFR